MMLLLSVPEMSCRELVRLITDYLEGELSVRDRRRFQRHLRGCDGCTTYVEQMRQTIHLTGGLGTELQVLGALKNQIKTGGALEVNAIAGQGGLLSQVFKAA